MKQFLHTFLILVALFCGATLVGDYVGRRAYSLMFPDTVADSQYAYERALRTLDSLLAR